jgi:sugar lactone lactonase YvrE
MASRTALLLYCLASLVASSPPQTSAQSYSWRNVEVGGCGFVTGTIFHPSEPGLVYARTDVGGIYRLDTATNRWLPLNDDIGGLNNEFQHLGVLTIGLDPNDANRLYIATGQYGGTDSWKLPSRIYRSTNRGASWISYVTPGFKMAGNGEGRGTGERMAVDPLNGANILVGTSDSGIWRSTDYGASWTRMTNFTPTGTNFVIYAPASHLNPGPNRRVYAAANTTTAQSFWFSDDNGTTWSEVPNHPGSTAGSEMMPIQGSFDSAGVFYSTWGNATGPSNYASRYGVFKISSNGTTWTSILPPTGQGFFAGISADPRVAGHVVVSTLQRWWPGDEVYRSTDGGSTWTAALRTSTRSNGNSPWASTTGQHWMTDIDIDPFNSNRAIFNTGYGLFQTSNLSTSGTARIWTFFNDGLEEAVPLGLHSPTAGPPLVSVIGDYTGFRHDDLNRSPLRGALSPGSGSTSVITGADLAPAKMIRQNSGTTLYSQDAAATWAAFPTTPAPIINGHNRVILSADGARLMWCPPNAPAYFSTNNGATWTISTNSTSLTNSNGTQTVAVLAGTAGTPGTTNATGGSARFNSPAAIALDSAGVRYVADTANHTIRKIAAGGAVSTFVGTAGESGSTDTGVMLDGTAIVPRFNTPAGITLDAAKNAYVADSGNHTIRKITSGGVVTTLAGVAGLTGSSDGGMDPAPPPDTSPTSLARFNTPTGLAVDAAGNLFVCDAGNHTIRKIITSTGVVTTLAGSPGLPGTTNANGSNARFNSPNGITLDSAGNLYVTDSGNHAIRKITPTGDVTTFAGLAGTSGSTDATGGSARFNMPKAITLDASGTFHVADSGNHTIRKITSDGVVTTVAGLAGTSGNANGSGTTARFNNPTGIAATPDGFNVYVADTANHTIRRNTLYNTLTPLADRVDGNRFYLWDNTQKRMLTSSDGGASFSVIATGVNSAFAAFRTVPGHNGHIWARAGSSGLYRSTNFGASFTKLSSVAEVYQFDFGKAAPSATHPAVFIWGKVGTTVGFFRSDDTGATWVRINDNMHQFGYQNDIAGDPRVYGRVYLATSGRGVVYGDFTNPVTPPPQAAQVVFDDALQNGWTNASTGGTSLVSTNPVYRGTTAISVPAGSGKGLSLTCSSRSLQGLDELSFRVHGGSTAPPPLQIGISRGGIALEAVPITVPSATGWQHIVIPLSQIGLAGIDDLTGLRIESRTVNSVTPGAFSLDDITLGNPTLVTITLSNLTATYDTTPKPVTVTTVPANVPVTVTYNGSSTVPTAAGTYAVSAVVNDPTAIGSATGTLVIAKAPASLELGNLIQSANGTPRPVTLTTTPPGVACTVTYNGSTTAPTYAGSYPVVATVTDPNYVGSASGTLVIRQTALVATDITGWSSNIAGKVTSTTSSSPLLDPSDVTDAYSTNTLQANFSPITLANTGDKITLSGTLQMTLAAVASQGNWFRFGLYDNRGQAPNIATDWLGLTAMGNATASLYERTSTGLFSTGSGATLRTVDTSPAPVGSSSPSGNPPLSFETTITRTATGVVSTHLIKRADTSATLLSYSLTETTPNNNGVLTAAQNTPTNPVHTPTYNTAGFAFARSYIGTTGTQAQFSNIQVAFTPGITAESQFITFPTIGDRPVTSPPFALTATASSGLPVSYQIVSGPATLSGGTLTVTGIGTVTVRASQAGNLTYLPAPDADQSFTVTKSPATVTLGSLNPTYNGSPKSATATTNPSGKTVEFTYNGSPTAPTAAGSYAVVGTINDANYEGSATSTLVIAPASQTIHFASLPGRTYGDVPFPLSATATSALPVTFSIVSGPATLNASTLTLDGAGTVVVRASQSGDSNHLAAPDVDQSFVIAKAPATITLGGLSAMFDGQPKPVIATTNPPGKNVLITYDGSVTPPSAVGSYAVVATIDDFNHQGSATGTLVIARRSFTSPVTGWLATNLTTIDGANTSSPLLNSGNGSGSGTTGSSASIPFFARIAPRVLSTVGDSLHIGGNVTVNAPAGNANQALWFRFGLFDNPNPAGSKTVNNWLGYTAMARSTAANSLYERIGGTTTGDFASSIYGTSGRTPDASPAYVGANSPSGVVTLRIDQTITRTATGVTVVSRLARPGTGGAADTVYLSSTYTDTTPNNNGLSNGTSQTTPSVPVYSPRYDSVGFVLSGDYINNTTNTSSAQFSNIEVTYTPGTDGTPQTIDFPAPADRVYGDAPFALTATADSGLPVSYTVANGPATVSGSTLTLTGVGDVTVRASQEGDVSYLPALPMERTFTVAKAPATITFGGLSHVYDGQAKAATATTSPPNLNVEIRYDGEPGAPYQIGDHEVTALVVDEHYEGSSSGTLVIEPIPQTVEFAPLPDKTFGDDAFALSASASSGLPVSFSVVSGPAALSGNTLTLTGAGAVTIRASQPGDGTRAPAPDVDRSFTVAKAAATISLENLTATYDGNPKAVTTTTNPANLAVNVTYDGSGTAPAAAGSYAVAASIVDANHQGEASGTLVILAATTALEDWRQSYFGTLENEGAAANQHDANGDGEPNLLEFATGQDPHSATRATTSAVKTGGTVEFHYTRSKAAADDGILFDVEHHDALNATPWISAGAGEILADGPQQSMKVVLPAPSAGPFFIRLKVSTP